MAISIARAREYEEENRKTIRISAVLDEEHYLVILEVKRALEEELGTKVSESFALRHILAEFARQNF